MKNGKYYTPSIEEFHVGFEFLAKDLHDNLVDETLRPEKMDENRSLRIISDWLKNDEIRVKHLDQEDIESFGWFHDENECYYDGNWGDIALYHSDGERKVRIVAYPHSPIKSSILFNGTIRNKSELKRVLTQIGMI
jgi:hypothetical protein